MAHAVSKMDPMPHEVIKDPMAHEVSKMDPMAQELSKKDPMDPYTSSSPTRHVTRALYHAVTHALRVLPRVHTYRVSRKGGRRGAMEGDRQTWGAWRRRR